MIPTAKTALVTHKGCLDGSGCAVMFILAGGNKHNIFFKSPKKCHLTAEEANPFDEVWFADVCPVDLTDPAGGKPWKVFDHHYTNIKRHGENHEHCCFDSSKCATTILYKEFGIDKWPNSKRAAGYPFQDWDDIVNAIEDYDLGRFEADAMFISSLAACYEQVDFIDLLYRNAANIYEEPYFQERVEAMNGIRDHYTSRAVKTARAYDLNGVWVATVSSPVYWKNEIAITLLDGRKVDGRAPDVVAAIDYATCIISLRSRENGVNVAEIAEKYGGGGHKKAAAFKMKSDIMYSALFQEVFS